MTTRAGKAPEGDRHAADLTGIELQAELGRGAATVVHRVRRAGRAYALKRPTDGDRGLLPAFQREAALLACVDDPGAARLVERARSLGVDTVAVGTDPSADVRVEDVVPTGAGSRFSVVDRGRRLGEVVLQVPGHHYVLDAAAALACGLRLGFGFEELARGLGSFTGTRRRMDCIDCHNVVAHRIAPSAEQAVDRAMAAGGLPQSLPFVRREGIRLVQADYPDEQTAMTGIAEGLRGFYKTQSGAVDVAAIERAVSTLQGVYRRNVFPTMNVTFGVYPDNLGHTTSPGCFRCHDGKHVSSAGVALTGDCKSCHLIMAQGKPDALEWASGPDGLEFVHPGDEAGDLWQSMACTDCHASGT